MAIAWHPIYTSTLRKLRHTFPHRHAGSSAWPQPRSGIMPLSRRTCPVPICVHKTICAIVWQCASLHALMVCMCSMGRSALYDASRKRRLTPTSSGTRGVIDASRNWLEQGALGQWNKVLLTKRIPSFRIDDKPATKYREGHIVVDTRSDLPFRHVFGWLLPRNPPYQMKKSSLSLIWY